jgi:hypothetical protein
MHVTQHNYWILLCRHGLRPVAWHGRGKALRCENVTILISCDHGDPIEAALDIYEVHSVRLDLAWRLVISVNGCLRIPAESPPVRESTATSGYIRVPRGSREETVILAIAVMPVSAA